MIYVILSKLAGSEPLGKVHKVYGQGLRDPLPESGIGPYYTPKSPAIIRRQEVSYVRYHCNRRKTV